MPPLGIEPNETERSAPRNGALRSVIAAVASALRLLAAVLTEPSRAFAEIREGNVSPALPIILCGLLLGVLGASFELNAYHSLSGFRPAAVHSLQQMAATATFFLTPILLALRVLVVAFLLFVGVSMFERPPDFRLLFTVVSSVQIVTILHVATQLIVVKIFGAPTHSTADIGMNLLFHVPERLDYMLAILNPFSIWYVYLLALSISVIGGFSMRRSILALVPYVAFFLAGTLFFSSYMFH
jgi:Yip1 domain